MFRNVQSKGTKLKKLPPPKLVEFNASFYQISSPETSYSEPRRIEILSEDENLSDSEHPAEVDKMRQEVHKLQEELRRLQKE